MYIGCYWIKDKREINDENEIPRLILDTDLCHNLVHFCFLFKPFLFYKWVYILYNKLYGKAIPITVFWCDFIKTFIFNEVVVFSSSIVVCPEYWIHLHVLINIEVMHVNVKPY